VQCDGKPQCFQRVLAPIKLIAAIALLVGLGYHPVRLAGAVAALAISCFCLVRLANPSRRDAASRAGFIVLGAIAAAPVAITIVSRRCVERRTREPSQREDGDPSRSHLA